MNYFDADISMESTNAILLNLPEKPGDPYTYNDYGVKQDFTCVPPSPPPFKYSSIKTYDSHGKLEPPTSIENMRKVAELYHRIKVEL